MYRSLTELRVRCSKSLAAKKGMTSKAEQNVRHLEAYRLKLSKKRKSEILTEEMLILLGSKVSPLMRMKEWELIFGINRDGISFRTFYASVQKHNPTIILIKDTKGNVFGGFASEKWHPSSRFYGTGESFLFTFKRKGSLLVYRWTGANDLILYSDYTRLIMGGG
eukprot:TRINITY_DN1082_c0_g6_i1.p1 TRINITY_DN1082_c0_g6~~TRINITY_DN1082_c0_g6_i1.p1  ORF type:complete len:165 (-),score=30.62 TRINITY_DN1082_c0_g6_i1:293-787(-)